jgi:hypothetical protein
MDWNYLLAIPSLLVGLLAGFQGVYERYGEDSYSAALKPPGVMYLLTRSILPAAVYLALYGSSLLPHPLWFWSLICGTAGTELILRTKIFIKEERGAESGPRELMYGPLDLLRWYQNLFLEDIRKYFPHLRGEDIQKKLSTILKDVKGFPEMSQKIENSLYLYDSEPEKQAAITADLSNYRAEYDAKVQAGMMTLMLDKVLQHKLGYRIIHHVGEGGLKLLLS